MFRGQWDLFGITRYNPSLALEDLLSSLRCLVGVLSPPYVMMPLRVLSYMFILWEASTVVGFHIVFLKRHLVLIVPPHIPALASLS